VASNQRTPAGQRLPVALAAVSAVDSKLSGHLAMVPEAADSGRCRGVRFPSHPDTAPRAAVPAEDCGRPPQRLRGIRQSPSQHGVSGRTPRLLVCAVNQDRPARPADTQGPDRRTGGAACGHRESAGARHRGFPQVRQWSCGHCNSSPAGQLAAEPSTSTAPTTMVAAVGQPNTLYIRSRSRSSYPSRSPDRQIPSLVLYVGLVGFRWIWAAQVGCLVDPVGSRRIPWDRLDGQADDQASQAA
jgi:hypothetical protein